MGRRRAGSEPVGSAGLDGALPPKIFPVAAEVSSQRPREGPVVKWMPMVLFEVHHHEAVAILSRLVRISTSLKACWKTVQNTGAKRRRLPTAGQGRT